MDDIPTKIESAPVKLHELVQHAWEQIQVDRRRGIELAKDARDIAKDAHDKAAYADSLAVLSWGYYRLSEFDLSLENGLEALSLYQHTKETELFRILLGVLGVVYFRHSDYSESLYHLHWQRRVSEATNDPFLKGQAHTGLAMIYQEIGEFERALIQNEIALALFTRVEDTKWIIIAYNNICYIFWQIKRYEESVSAARKGIALCEQHPHFVRQKGWLLANIPVSLQALGHIDEAREAIHEAEGIAEAIEDRMLRAIIHITAGRFHLNTSELALAAEQFQKAIVLTKALGTKRQTYDAYKLLAQVYRSQGKLELALQNYDNYIDLRESLLNENVLAKIRNLEIAQRTADSRKKAEQAELLSAELEARVAQRTAELEDALTNANLLGKELNAALKHASSVNDQRAELIKTVSHAFRTPMTVIRTSTDILDKYIDKLSSKKRDEYFHRIRNAISNLGRMINDAELAHVSSIALIEIAPVEYTFAQLCTMLKDRLTVDLAHPSNLAFVFDPTCQQTVFCDMAQIKRVLFNLLSNAIKFCPYQPVEVHFMLKDSILVIEVRDQGVGIPPVEIDNLFKLFTRASNVETVPGLGLGLYVAKRIVKAMRGMISAESPGLDLGSTFTIRLPSSAPRPSMQ